MTTPGHPDTMHARLFNAITRAIPNDRFVSLSERKAITDAVMAILVPDLRELVAAGEQAIAAAGTRALEADADLRLANFDKERAEKAIARVRALREQIASGPTVGLIRSLVVAELDAALDPAEEAAR